MPIYPYACGACGHEFDLLQKVSDHPLRQCPECGEESLRKKITAAAFHLKGTGWYETDFKNKDAKKDQKEDQKSEKKEADGEGGKGKTEEKKEGVKTKDNKSGDKSTASASTQSSTSESKKTDSN